MNIAFGHSNMDLDSLGSLILVKNIFPDYTLVRSRAIHPVAYGLFNLYEDYFGFSDPKDLENETIDNIIIVDTSTIDRVREFLGCISNVKSSITIYDHHPGENCDIPGAELLLNNCGANTSYMCKLAMEKGIRLGS